VRAIDVKPAADWFQRFDQADNRVLDLRELPKCRAAGADTEVVWNLASDRGGMGFIENNKAL